MLSTLLAPKILNDILRSAANASQAKEGHFYRVSAR